MALSLLFPFHVCSGLIGFRLIRHKRVFFGQATSPLVRCKQISAPKFHRENICQGQKSFLKILKRHQRLIEHQFKYSLPSHAFLVRPGEGSGISGIFQSGLFFRISIQRAPLEQHSHVSCHLPLKRTWTTTRFHYKAITGVRNSRTINNMVFVNTSENVVGGLEPNFTRMTMLWGSFIDHHFTLTVSNQTEGCGTNNAPCSRNVP